MLRRFILAALAAIAFTASPASAQTCNSPSGFVKSMGEYSVGDVVIFGPDCEQLSGAASVGIPASNIFYTPPWTGASVMTQQAYDEQRVSVRDWGVTGLSAQNATAGINAAFANAGGRKIEFPCGTYTITGALTMTTISSVVGMSQSCVLWRIDGVPIGTDVWTITPVTQVGPGMEIANINVYFDVVGAAPSRHFIKFDTAAAGQSLAYLNVHDTTVAGIAAGVQSGIAGSVFHASNTGLNLGGGLFYSTFERNNWYGVLNTVSLNGVGDHLHFRDNHYHSDTGLCKNVSLIAGAGNYVSDSDSYTCAAGAFVWDAGAAFQLKSPLIEQTGLNTSGVIANIRGAVSKINGATLEAPQIQEPTALNNPISINIDNADNVTIANAPLINRFAPGTHLNVTASATRVVWDNNNNCQIANVSGACTIINAAGSQLNYTWRMPAVNAQTILGNYSGSPVINPLEIVAGATFAYSGNQIQTVAMTGDVTSAANSFATTIANAAITYAKFQNVAALSVVGRSANSSGVSAAISATPASDAVLRESGSVLGFGTIATGGIANNAVTLAKLATQAANTVLGNATAGAAVPTALAMTSCSAATEAVRWTTSTGFGCNTALNAALLGGATFASPAAIGSGTPAAGTFTTLHTNSNATFVTNTNTTGARISVRNTTLPGPGVEFGNNITSVLGADSCGTNYLGFGIYAGATCGQYTTEAIIAGLVFASDGAGGGYIAGLSTSQTNVLPTKLAYFQASGGLGIGTSSDPGAGMIYTNAAAFMSRTKTSWTNGAAAAAGTIANAPAAGNPTKWIPVDDNGTTRYVPAW